MLPELTKSSRMNRRQIRQQAMRDSMDQLLEEFHQVKNIWGLRRGDRYIPARVRIPGLDEWIAA